MKCPSCGSKNTRQMDEEDLTTYWACNDCGWEGRK